MNMSKTTRTSASQKALLIFFGLLCVCLTLEVTLRFGGWLFFVCQEKANTASLAQQSEYRILCVGESTTALGGPNSYPRQLEEILNSRQKKVHFTVINKGCPSATTTQIVSRIPEMIAQYQPQIVVTMLGVNDGPNFPLASDGSGKRPDRLLMKSRAYKLFKLLVIHIQDLLLDYQVRKSDEKLAQLERRIDQYPKSQDYERLAGFYRVETKYDLERKILTKAIKTDPQNYDALAYLAFSYKREAEYDQAIDFFKRSIEFAPDNSEIKIQSYANLGECYQLKGQYDLAQQVYEEGMRRNSKYVWGVGAIGSLLVFQEKYNEAIKYFQAQINLDPSGIEFYTKLAQCYFHLGQLPAAEKVLRMGIKNNPKAAVLYAELGAHLIDMKRYAEAEALLWKSLEFTAEDFEGKDINVYGLLARCAESQGKTLEAKKLLAKRDGLQSPGGTTTSRNYQSIRSMVAQNKIQLIAMQYPLRDISTVKQMLPSGNTIFVENRTNFHEALKQHPYEEYFADRFAGDFGHCTERGNHLIAQNLADTILKELFK
jgi:tetratricopeptide (TPR) repeat protein